VAIENLGGNLRDYTTLRVGGGARQIVRVTTDLELINLVTELDQKSEPLLILGGGSNVVCADSTFPGTVIIVATEGVDWAGERVRVAAGENWDTFVTTALEHGNGGLAPLAGIPGSMGATPIQNIGAYGVELAEFVSQVEVWDRTAGIRRILSVNDCEFEYRGSVFKKDPNRYVLLAVTLKLASTLEIAIEYQQLADVMKQEVGTTAQSAAVRDQVLQLRSSKSMVLDLADADSNSTGSFFINPTALHTEVPPGCPSYSLGEINPRAKTHVKLSAAWLIENAGIAKGFALSDGDSAIRVSRNHTLAIVNPDQGTAQAVIELASYLRQQVFNAYRIELIAEPVLIHCELDQITRN